MEQHISYDIMCGAIHTTAWMYIEKGEHNRAMCARAPTMSIHACKRQRETTVRGAAWHVDQLGRQRDKHLLVGGGTSQLEGEREGMGQTMEVTLKLVE